jgi:hypothetical protein
MLENIEGTLTNGQSRETGNIGYTRRRQTNVREYRRDTQNGQSRETGNIGYTRRRKIRLNYNTIGVTRHYT